MKAQDDLVAVRSIASLARDGLCAAEIAARLGLPVQRVWRLAARWQLSFQPRGGARRIAAELPPTHYLALCSLAEAAAVPPSAMLARIAGSVLAAGPTLAAHRLGKAARPRRAYRREGSL